VVKLHGGKCISLAWNRVLKFLTLFELWNAMSATCEGKGGKHTRDKMILFMHQIQLHLLYKSWMECKKNSPLFCQVSEYDKLLY
jgi:hypothetical protein